MWTPGSKVDTGKIPAVDFPALWRLRAALSGRFARERLRSRITAAIRNCAAHRQREGGRGRLRCPASLGRDPGGWLVRTGNLRAARE